MRWEEKQWKRWQWREGAGWEGGARGENEVDEKRKLTEHMNGVKINGKEKERKIT